MCKDNNLFNVCVKCKILDGAILPEYKTSQSAGADICAYIKEPIVLKKGQRSRCPLVLFIKCDIVFLFFGNWFKIKNFFFCNNNIVTFWKFTL